MRTIQNTSSWCLRGQNHRSPDTPPLSQMCTMAWRRLRALLSLLRDGFQLNSISVSAETNSVIRYVGFVDRAKQASNLSQCAVRGAKAWATSWSFLRAYSAAQLARVCS